jgi:protein ImuA
LTCSLFVLFSALGSIKVRLLMPFAPICANGQEKGEPPRDFPTARASGLQASGLQASGLQASSLQEGLRTQRLAALRQAVAKLESRNDGTPSLLSLGVPEIDRHLPDSGLTCGVLHEVTAETRGDQPSALGFLFVLMAAAQRARPGPTVFIATRRSLMEFGIPYGHGMRQLGLDTGRLVLIETRSDRDALWALEETLRSQAGPAIVTGAIEGDLDLTISRRLNLAAGTQGTPLVVLRAASMAGTSAAATRWRVAAASAVRDRFGVLAHWRWRAALERCRNGRPGQWLIEWTHVAHCFRLAEGVADHAHAASASIRRAG